MNKKRKRFLITVLRFHGDVLLTSPIINTIRRVYPDAIIDLLVYKGTGVLLENHSGIHNILEADHSSKLNFTQRLFSEWKLLKRLRNTNYDFGLFLTTQWRIAFMGRALRSARTAAVDDKKRRNSLWINSFSSIFPEAGENHVIERNLRALESLGIKTEKEDFKLTINIPESSKFFVEKCKEDYAFKGPFCVIHPVSRRKSKQWKKQAFATLADQYSSLGTKVILTSGPEEDEIKYIEEISELAKEKSINLGGKTSLLDLAALIQGANFFIGLDSVASHIAAAVNTPGVVLFGPSKPGNWRPWSGIINVISRKGNEKFCATHGHLQGKLKNCLCYISPEKVISSLDSLVN